MGKDLNGKELGKGFSQRKGGLYEARATVKGFKIDLYNMDLGVLKSMFEEEKERLLRDEFNVRTNVTLGSWFEEWFEKCKRPQIKTEISQAVYYRKIKNSYIKKLGDKQLDNITQIQIQKATNEMLESGSSAYTLEEALSGLRLCFESACANRILTNNPCVQIKINNRYVKQERRVLEHWEQDLLLQITDQGYYRELYRVLLLTGMRIGELAALQWQDVDFDKKQITVRRSLTTGYVDGKKIEKVVTPKTNCGWRTIPFIADVETYLLDQQAKQTLLKQELGSRWRADPEFGDLVFTTRFGSPANRYAIDRDMKTIHKNMMAYEKDIALYEGREPREIKSVYPHALRHTFATRCFEKGLKPIFVQRIMGHSNYSTTVSYTHVLSEEIKNEVRKAGNFLD